MFYWVLMGFTWFFPSLTGFDWVLPSFTEFYRVSGWAAGEPDHRDPTEGSGTEFDHFPFSCCIV